MPHWEAGERPQAITFRLADSLPAGLLARWDEELAALPAIAQIVETALLYFDADRYRVHAWVIMPNHVHVMISPLNDNKLFGIAHSWKSFTARKANELLGRSGAFWSREYFDRAIRDEAHYNNAVAYFAMNPVKAGLCTAVENWRFSSAWSGRKSRQDASAPRV